MARVVDQRDRAVRHMTDQGVDAGYPWPSSHVEVSMKGRYNECAGCDV